MKLFLKDSRDVDKKHSMVVFFLPDSSAKYPLTAHSPFKITSLS